MEEDLETMKLRATRLPFQYTTIVKFDGLHNPDIEMMKSLERDLIDELNEHCEEGWVMYANRHERRYKIEVRFVENYCGHSIWRWMSRFLDAHPYSLRVENLVRLRDSEGYRKVFIIDEDGKCIQESLPLGR